MAVLLLPLPAGRYDIVRVGSLTPIPGAQNLSASAAEWAIRYEGGASFVMALEHIADRGERMVAFRAAREAVAKAEARWSARPTASTARAVNEALDALDAARGDLGL